MANPIRDYTGGRATPPPSPRGRIGMTRRRGALLAATILALAALILFYGRGLVPGVYPQTPAPKAYVGLFKDNAVAVLDSRTNRVVTTIPIPTGPHGLVATLDGRRVYASSDGASTVSVIDTATDTVTASIDVGQAPHGLAITPDGEYVLVAVFGSNKVAYIDTRNNKIVGQVPVPSPHNIAISPDGKLAYVAAQKPGATSLVMLDVDKRDQVGVIPVPKTPRALNFSPDGRQLFFTEAGIDAIQVLDPATNQIVAQTPVGASPHQPLFTPKGNVALIVIQGPGDLGILDPLTHTLSGTVPVGKFPHWAATSADGRWAYVTNENSNDVSVVDLTTRQVTATIPVGHGPRKIVLLPTPGQATTANLMPLMPGIAMAGPGIVETTPAILAAAAPASASTGKSAVSIASFAFTPGILTVSSGLTVTWTNHDSIPHTVTSDAGTWDSGAVAGGVAFNMRFDQPGAYSYHCSIHPFMQGTVIVNG
jgi:YVTN family beta-propeller protein